MKSYTKPDTPAGTKILKPHFLGLLGRYCRRLPAFLPLYGTITSTIDNWFSLSISTHFPLIWSSTYFQQVIFTGVRACVILKVEHPGQTFKPLDWHDICYFVISTICCPVVFHCRHFHYTHDQLHSNECFDFRGISVDGASYELTWIQVCTTLVSNGLKEVC